MSGRGDVTVVMPIYEDWESASALVGGVQRALDGAVARVDFLLVNDGSVTAPPAAIALAASPVASVRVLHLRRNLGHQRAIAIGLSHLQADRCGEAGVVMDGDGEDTPEGVAALLGKFRSHAGARTVFAERARRTEGVVFKAFYALFRVLHRALTGRGVRVGNFSVVPRAHLDRLVAISEIWNHYAAGVYRARLPIDTIPIDRGRRIAGESRMNFTSLLAHGLSAISVFSDVVGMRLLIFAGALGVLATLGIATAAALRFFTALAIPGWATTVAGTLLVVILQAFLMSVVFVFLILQGRNQHGFLPIRDHAYFIERVETLASVTPDDAAARRET